MGKRQQPQRHGSTGVAMVISMVTGYLSSVIVIPALCSLLRSGRRRLLTYDSVRNDFHGGSSAAGCATVPFREAPAVSMETVDPLEVVAQFREHLPESFQLLNTVVFDYTWRKFLGVGYVGIDRT